MHDPPFDFHKFPPPLQLARRKHLKKHLTIFYKMIALLNDHLRPRTEHESGAEGNRTEINLCAAPVHHKWLEGKVAIITGSGQGLGAEAAKLFAEHGAKLVISDIDGAKAEQTATAVREAGGEALVVVGDVTADDFATKIVEATVKEYGGIDILINNAGFTWDGMIHKISPKQWEAMLAVHCTAPFRIIQAATPYFREAARKEIKENGKPKDRSIINVSSTTGTHGNTGQANYSTAKAGVLGLTKTVAKEWGAFGVRCNAVTYGLILTRLTGEKGEGGSMKVGGQEVKLGIPGGEAFQQMAVEMAIPLKRMGTAKEAAGAMLLLASPYASFISGQSLEVTGGAFI